MVAIQLLLGEFVQYMQILLCNRSIWLMIVTGKKNSDEKWKIGDEEMEEVESFKYLGVWFD